ncbi:GNAT family N-acetyltransferase [Actinokineospora iranica]|uniref:Ribosomal protein S18 acetylase RimI n=1 Tax=Actinokineospora iranica TaxID=1271860 RepID=A0A1G6WAI1_9PSEU|nr:GNAT family N-acetyltransferase [Actinokineospora iranica]SDD62794.1 Ribosomal protein S18 acetylase RimI [Actinokineospora iranica]
MLTFRLATLADVPALVSLVESAYRGETSRAGWTSEAHLLDGRRTDASAVTEVITSPNSALLVAERGGAIVACAQVADRDGSGYFGMFAVTPTLQGDGIGSQMLAEVERIVAREWGLPELTMRVLTGRDELVAWYLRRGYRHTGETIPFPYASSPFGTPRRADLAFVVMAKSLR